MKKLSFGPFLFFLLSIVSYTQSLSKEVELKLKSDKKTYSTKDKLAFQLTIKNLSSKNLQILDNQNGKKLMLLLLDGIEYKSEGATAWGGPSSLQPNGEITIAIDPIEYRFDKMGSKIGKHHLAVKFSNSISNTLTFIVSQKN